MRFSSPASQQHLALIAASLLFGFVCVLPHLWQRLDRTFPFQGIEMMGTDQEYYASRIREVRDGNLWIGDLYYSDLKHDPYVQPPLPEWIQGGIGAALGLDIGQNVVFAKFLFGALLFFCVGLFAFRLFERPWASLLGTAAALFSWFLFSSPWVLAHALSGGQVAGSIARFSRLTNPQVSVIPFFLALWAFMRWRETAHHRYLALAGVCTGLAFYAYFYTWSLLGCVFGVLTMHAVWRRDWPRVRAMGVLLCVTTLVAVPYLFHLRETVAHPGYADLAMRIGMVATHRPLWGTWAAALLLLGACFGRVLSPRHRDVLVALGVAGFLALNQQVFTGRALVPQHYHWYFIHPLGILTLVTALGAGVLSVLHRVRLAKAAPLLWTLTFAFFVYWGAVFQSHAFTAQREEWGKRQEWSVVLSVLDDPQFAHTAVYAPGVLADQLTVYTPVDVVAAVNTSNCCLTPASRLRDVYFFEQWLSGLLASEANARFFSDKRDEVSRRLYGIYHRERTGRYDSISDEAIGDVADAYAAYAKEPLCAKLGKQPFDFFLWPTGGERTGNVSELLRNAKKIFGDRAWELWDLREVCPR